jgi:hypothetical protein
MRPVVEPDEREKRTGEEDELAVEKEARRKRMSAHIPGAEHHSVPRRHGGMSHHGSAKPRLA